MSRESRDRGHVTRKSGSWTCHEKVGIVDITCSESCLLIAPLRDWCFTLTLNSWGEINSFLPYSVKRRKVLVNIFDCRLPGGHRFLFLAYKKSEVTDFIPNDLILRPKNGPLYYQ